MKKLFANMILGAALVFTGGASRAQLVINEFSADNEELLADCDGDFPDWVEIYNHSNDAVSLNDWFLSDRVNDLYKWSFPDMVIVPQGFLIVFASDKNKVCGNEVHTSFKIDETNEGCYLSHLLVPNVSCIEPHTMPSDLSCGRIPDGTSTVFYFQHPTPGTSNNLCEPEFFDQNDILFFDQAGGAYAEPFVLNIYSSRTDIDIYYTIDGSPATTESARYNEPILVGAEEWINNGLSFIPTSDTWQQPVQGVRKIVVVRATPFHNGIPAGPEVVHSYFIGENLDGILSQDIWSIAIEPQDLFSDSAGIYVHGDATWGNFSERGMEAERKVFVEYFSKDNGYILRQSAGARIHGRSSRFSPQKTLRLYARERYGEEMFHIPGLANLDSPEYKELLLRAPESLFSTSLFTDELAQTIVGEMNVDRQAHRLATVFINGEYWGIHHTRERLGKHYLEEHHGVNEDAVDILDWDNALQVLEGNNENYLELVQFLKQNDLSENENYEVIESWIDIPSFIDYISAQLFFANEDFTENNVRLWREQKPGAKWRFFFFDADATMREHWQDRLTEFFNTTNDEDPITLIFGSLLKNEEFRKTFSATFLQHLSTTFSPDRILSLINEMEEEHSALVPDHIRRWNRPQSYAEWQNALDGLRNFALMRPPVMLEMINENFDHPFDIYPNPSDTQVNVRFFADASIVAPVITTTDISGAMISIPYAWNGNIATLDLSNVSAGLYIVRIDLGKMSYADKIIIQ